MHHPDYHEISRRFRRTTGWDDAVPLTYPGEGVDLYFLSFESLNGKYLLGNSGYACAEHGLTFPGEPTLHAPTDAAIEENLRFRYFLVREHQAGGGLRRHDRVVVLFHGLNERSFTKYIPWAYHIWRSTGSPVILFPLTFHINRVLPGWAARAAEELRRAPRPARQRDGPQVQCGDQRPAGGAPGPVLLGSRAVVLGCHRPCAADPDGEAILISHPERGWIRSASLPGGTFRSR